MHFDAVNGEEFAFTDKETGSNWDLEGQATAGPLAGESLSFVTSFLTEWYGWLAYHPETDIFSEGAQNGLFAMHLMHITSYYVY